MMKTLDEYGEIEKHIERGFPIGESVRNSTFDSIRDELPDRQKEIFDVVLQHSPKGISTKAISNLTGKPMHTFSGRISEMANPKMKQKHPYWWPPLIVPCGVDILEDYNGKMRTYTKYRVAGEVQ